MRTREEFEKVPIAQLEGYGVSVRHINKMEIKLGLLYVGDMKGISMEMLSERMGNKVASSIVDALKSLLNGS